MILLHEYNCITSSTERQVPEPYCVINNVSCNTLYCNIHTRDVTKVNVSVQKYVTTPIIYNNGDPLCIVRHGMLIQLVKAPLKKQAHFSTFPQGFDTDLNATVILPKKELERDKIVISNIRACWPILIACLKTMQILVKENNGMRQKVAYQLNTDCQ